MPYKIRWIRNFWIKYDAYIRLICNILHSVSAIHSKIIYYRSMMISRTTWFVILDFCSLLWATHNNHKKVEYTTTIIIIKAVSKQSISIIKSKASLIKLSTVIGIEKSMCKAFFLHFILHVVLPPEGLFGKNYIIMHSFPLL